MPEKGMADDVNEAVLLRVSDDVVEYNNNDSTCKTMDHVGDADLLYTPEFLHLVKLSNFPCHLI